MPLMHTGYYQIWKGILLPFLSLKELMKKVFKMQKEFEGRYYYLVIRDSGHAYAEWEDNGSLLRFVSGDPETARYTNDPPP